MAKDVVVDEGDGDEIVPGAGAVISAEDLLSIDALDAVYVPLPEPWRGGIKARPLTNAEFRQITSDHTTVRKTRHGRVVDIEYDNDAADKAFIVASLVEPALTAAQVDVLWLKNSKLCRAILTALNKLNATGAADEAEVVEKGEAAFRA
jgi:hypothetical protein